MLTSPASFIIGVGSGNFLNNVVLVDFFKRDLGTQQIQINNITGFPAGIHTVEQENNIVTLIDPNNFIFSNPLENFVKFLGPSLFPNLVPPFTIEIEQNIHGNKQKFYKSDPTIPVGRGTNDSRDCTDVAVKIAFKLNEEQQKGINNIANIATLLDRIKSLSNQKAVNILIPYDEINMNALQDLFAARREEIINLLTKYKGNTNLAQKGGITTLAKLQKFDRLLTEVETFCNQPAIQPLLQDLNKLQVVVTKR